MSKDLPKGLLLVVQFGLALITPLAQTAAAESIPLKSERGTLVLPVLINDRITLDFVLDSGASDVSIPLDVFSTLRRTGTISDSELLPPTEYTLADGTVEKQMRFRIRTLKAGDFELHSVVGSVAPPQGELLLGQSFLRRLRNWSIDNKRRVLIINGRVAETESTESKVADVNPVRNHGSGTTPTRAAGSKAALPRWERCTPAQIREGECDDKPLPRAGTPPSEPDDERSQTPPAKWERCTPAQIRAGECK
jgi:hypothetical protein